MIDFYLTFIEPHLGKIFSTLMVAAILGIWGIIRSFFKGIKKMGKRIDKLEKDLEDNTRSDQQLEKYVNVLIEQKLKR